MYFMTDREDNGHILEQRLSVHRKRRSGEPGWISRGGFQGVYPQALSNAEHNPCSSEQIIPQKRHGRETSSVS